MPRKILSETYSVRRSILPHCLTHPHASSEDNIGFLRDYVTRLQTRVERGPQELNPRLLRNLRKEWHPILGRMRRFAGDSRLSIVRTTSFWLKFGEKIGMKDGVPAPDDELLVVDGCCWKDCLCSGIEVGSIRYLEGLGHPLRECTGCQNIWYCSKRCQKECVQILHCFCTDTDAKYYSSCRDWPRHRNVCPGRRGQV